MPRLVIKQGEGVGRDKVLSGGGCIVGRDAATDFPLGDNLSSRQHFKVFQEQGVYWIEDLGSTNGTIVNGRRVARAQLKDGDLIVAGTTHLLFVQKDLLGGGGTAARQAPVARPPATPPPAQPPAAPTRAAKSAPTPRRRRRR